MTPTASPPPTVRVDYDAYESLCRRIVLAKGMKEDDAAYTAAIAATAEAMGIHTHSAATIRALVKHAGTDWPLEPGPRLAVDRPAALVIEGSNCPGQMAMRLALDAAMARAAETGTCLLTCRNAQWIGPIQPYLLQPVCRGLMVQVWVQYSGGQPCAPHGGIDGRLSTNPLGIGIPLGESAMLADFSTSAISVGRARREHTHGLHAPEPIYQDPEGNLSAQPGAYVDGGTMLPTGGIHYGYKGTALSMWHEAITAAGGGEVSNPDIPGRQAVGMLIVAPGVLGDAARFAEQMHALAERIAASRPRDPDRPVRLPGQRALRDWRRARQEGIAVPADNHALLLDLARQVHVEPGDVPTG